MLNRGILDKFLHDYRLCIGGFEVSLLQGNVMEVEEVGNSLWDGAVVLSHYLESVDVEWLRRQRLVCRVNCVESISTAHLCLSYLA